MLSRSNVYLKSLSVLQMGKLKQITSGFVGSFVSYMQKNHVHIRGGKERKTLLLFLAKDRGCLVPWVQIPDSQKQTFPSGDELSQKNSVFLVVQAEKLTNLLSFLGGNKEKKKSLDPEGC